MPLAAPVRQTPISLVRLRINVRSDLSDAKAWPEWRDYASGKGSLGMYCDPAWLEILCDAFDHKPYLIEARVDGKLVGLLPLCLVKSVFFGSFLVSLPYVNWAGALFDDATVATALVDRAVTLASKLGVRHLQIRNLEKIDHQGLGTEYCNKAQMRLPLTSESEAWSGVRQTVRSQVRKAKKNSLEVRWGRQRLLDDFYSVFSQNMRDLGTPVFGRVLFSNILDRCEDAELCIIRQDSHAIAGALCIHGPGLTEVPSAACLKKARPTAANSLMYWHAIKRAIEKGQTSFDFGRSSPGSGTYDFKKKWGAMPLPVTWQFSMLKGESDELRPDNGKFGLAIRTWQRLPLSVTKVIGPKIVRGIP